MWGEDFGGVLRRPNLAWFAGTGLRGGWGAEIPNVQWQTRPRGNIDKVARQFGGVKTGFGQKVEFICKPRAAIGPTERMLPQ